MTKRTNPQKPQMRPRPAALPSAEGVAQVSKPAVSRVSKPANRCQYQARRRIPRHADLEVGDTAGLETCATYEAEPGARTLSMHFLLPPSQMTALLRAAASVMGNGHPPSKKRDLLADALRLGEPRAAEAELEERLFHCQAAFLATLGLSAGPSGR